MRADVEGNGALSLLLRPASARLRGGPLAGAARRREGGLVLGLVLFGVVVSVHSTRFVAFDNLRNIVNSVAILALVAVGQTLVVLARQIDLSVGSQVGLVAYLADDLLKHHPGLGTAGALVYGCAIGIGLGAFNGLLVVVGDVPAIVATLGTLYIYRGIDFLIAGGKVVDASQVPQGFLTFTTTHALVLPPPVIVIALLAIVVAFGLRATRSGRELFAVGSNPDAARMVGIRSGRRVFGAFVLTGALCGIAGVLWSSFYGTVASDAATGFELTVVAAVVVGGVNIFGGSGTILGVIVAAVFFGAIDNGLAILNVSEYWLQAITGAAILAAVTLDAIVARRTQRALLAEGGQ